MKRNNCYNNLILMASVFFLISGCRKVYDYVESHPGAEIKSCGIAQFIYRPLYSDYTDTLTFTYNLSGDPIKAVRPEPRTGAPNFLFRYKNGRLSEFIGVYENGTATETWHRYFYDASGRVTVDSVYIFANMVNGSLSDPFDRYAVTFIYDNKKRIIQETNTYSDGSTSVQTYQYNADGNRAGSTYGHGVSFRRSNNIWMFLDRDYSVNDRAGSGSYNVFQMPTLINLGADLSDVFLGNYFNTARINYLCDSGH